MPVNTNVQNAKAIFDACADYLDVTVDNAKAVAIAEEFIDQVGGPTTNEEKAGAFIQAIVDIVRGTGRSHVGTATRQANEGAVETAMDNAASNF